MRADMTKNEIVSLAIEIIIKVVLLGIVLFWAFMILQPFIVLVIWAIIIAVTLSPLIEKLEERFKGRRTMIVSAITLTAVLTLLVPTYMLSDSIIVSSQNIAQNLKEGTLQVPPPSDKVAEWPLIGEQLYAFWNGAATNLEQTLQKYQPQLQKYGGKIASAVGGGIGAVVQFVIALIIAALFLSKSEGSVKVYQGISRRLMGEKGVEWAQLSAMTVRSVVQGVIGIALIQSALSLIGMLAIGVPFAPLWAFLILFLAIIQLPTIIILGPIIAYVFSYADTTPAVIFAIYAILIGLSDNILKPLLLGRGVDIPMLVILLGAIGGMILSGIIGLFVGAVVLALAYKLFVTWLQEEEEPAESS
ncbi:MAG: AI-2E family transporter [Sulfurimonadaceae bacterium]